jgi:two-component system chemotaxis sensor kinase CheA
MSAADNPLLAQFIPEARDLIEEAGRSLLALERTPGASEPMNALFRAVHTLKGTSGLFEVGPLTRTVHAAEDLLGAVQAGTAQLGGEQTDLLLGMLDRVGQWIEDLAERGDLPPGAEADAETWVTRLRARHADGPAAAGAAGEATALAEPPAWLSALLPEERGRCAAASAPLHAVSTASSVARTRWRWSDACPAFVPCGRR